MLRWGIIGCGDIVERGMGPALSRAANTKLVSVYSRSLDKAKVFAGKFHADRAYDSLDSMLADPELDIVYIATPNSLHPPQTIQAAQAGKHVLCEKPMALTVADGERMITACDKNKVKLGVVFQNRYHPAHFEARRRLQAGDLGSIDMATAQLCRGGAQGRGSRGWRGDPAMAGLGAIVAQAVHPLDLLRFVLDSEIEEVQAMAEQAAAGAAVEEMIYSLLKFRNGVRGICVAGSLVPRFDNDLVLYGTKAKIVCKGTLGSPAPGALQEYVLQCDAEKIKTGFLPVHTMADKVVRVVEDFNRAVADNAELGISGENGLQLVKIAVALGESAKHGRAVRVS